MIIPRLNNLKSLAPHMTTPNLHLTTNNPLPIIRIHHRLCPRSTDMRGLDLRSFLGNGSLEGDESGPAADGGGYFGIGKEGLVWQGGIGSACVGEDLGCEIDGAGGAVGG